MSSRKSWLCDGVSKNSKQYSSIYKPHKPYENYGLRCQICGNPREAMTPNQSIKRRFQIDILSRKNLKLSRRATSSETWQLLLVLVIPTLSVICALYFMLIPILKSRIELSQNYENVNYGIKIKYPQTWEIQDKQDPTVTGDLAVLLPHQVKDECLVALTVAVDDFTENSPSLEEYKKSVIQKITTLNPNTKIADESASAKLSNSDAYRLAYTRKDQKCSLQVMEIGTVRNNKAYYITYKASANTYDNFSKPVEEIIKSFEIKEVKH